ncbi:MAG: hypothetical protein K2R98_30585 [Gemmataceae bacterium]|nr:hypothetical protein [Gemmataceae bacterium]
MKPKLALVVLFAALCLWPVAARAEVPWTLFDGSHWHYPHLCEQWRQRRCWCADDYRGKSLPCVPPNPKGCVDDYRGKSLPCVPPNPKGCVDDYCPTKCPLLLWRCCGPHCTCGPPEETCGPCRDKRKP